MQISETYSVGYPLQRLFVPIPFVSFGLALATDIAFWQTGNLMWQNFSAWLLFAGVVFGIVALLAGVIDLLRPSTRLLRASLAEILGFLVMIALAIINSLVHAGDGWTAVVPNGLALSAATFIVSLITLIFAARSQRVLKWRAAA
ncbi:DUF2231 domain-containing protein [Rhizobium cauense]|uniref:DUF2231 domain-containing protein n=1 Tax=Rhizobium cauense TaxID=1166683 RepID=UPI001C6E12CA|nr:DUF2231 domain-containing protein [Rhizobium cauense]MBW9117692.1 DUF2231 domain-containing protein [Rhizobium cauense]